MKFGTIDYEFEAWELGLDDNDSDVEVIIEFEYNYNGLWITSVWNKITKEDIGFSVFKRDEMIRYINNNYDFED
jgi:hypothetical protein